MTVHDENELTFVIDQQGCARCGGEGHEGLLFTRFIRPVIGSDGQELARWWALCPTTGEPILMAIVTAT